MAFFRLRRWILCLLLLSTTQSWADAWSDCKAEVKKIAKARNSSFADLVLTSDERDALLGLFGAESDALEIPACESKERDYLSRTRTWSAWLRRGVSMRAPLAGAGVICYGLFGEYLQARRPAGEELLARVMSFTALTAEVALLELPGALGETPDAALGSMLPGSVGDALGVAGAGAVPQGEVLERSGPPERQLARAVLTEPSSSDDDKDVIHPAADELAEALAAEGSRVSEKYLPLVARQHDDVFISGNKWLGSVLKAIQKTQKDRVANLIRRLTGEQNRALEYPLKEFLDWKDFQTLYPTWADQTLLNIIENTFGSSPGTGSGPSRPTEK